MKLPHECRSIDDVRQGIDDIDNQIIDLIGKRFSYIKEIVRFKNNEDDVYAKSRYNAVIHRRRELAQENKLDPDVIEKIYRIMMDYFIQEQLELLKNK